MRESDFTFDLVQIFYCKFHKVSFRGAGSYIDSPDQMTKKNATINPKNKDEKIF